VKWDHAAPTRGLRLVEAGRCPPHPVRSLPTTAPTKGTTKQAAVMTKKVLRVRWTGRPMGLSRLFYGGTGRALQPSPWMKAQPLRGSELGIDAVSAADLWTRQADPLAGRPAPSLGTVRQPPKAPPPSTRGRCKRHQDPPRSRHPGNGREPFRSRPATETLARLHRVCQNSSPV
jgi:hypothetical protein